MAYTQGYDVESNFFTLALASALALQCISANNSELSFFGLIEVNSHTFQLKSGSYGFYRIKS